MKHLFIIRHGETDNNKIHKLQGRAIDASINEMGREQALAVADALKEIPIQKVVTSSLKRTYETAEPLLTQKNLGHTSYSELDEMGFGDWEGLYFEDVIGQIREIQARWLAGNVDVPVPGGESPQEVFERAGGKVKDIVREVKEQYIAIFVHGRLIRILLAGLLGMGLKNMQEIKHRNGSINHITWDGEQFIAKELNMINHLEGLLSA